MAVKELRQGMRARLFVGVFLAVHLFAITAIVVESIDPTRVFAGSATDDFWLLTFLDTPPPFWLVVEVIFFAVLPLTGFTALQSEVDGANVELLLLSTLTRWRVVCGKWILMTSQSSLILLSLLPYLVVRYFFGGVDILRTLFLVACALALNAMLNAIFIGASAYRHWLMLCWMIVYQIVSAAVTTSIAVGAVIYMLGEAFGLEITTSPLIFNPLIGLFAGATAALYVAFGLQLGRGRIRLFERAFETAESGVVSVLLFTAPIFVGMVTIITVGFGTLPAILVLGWSVYKLDASADATPDELYPTLKHV